MIDILADMTWKHYMVSILFVLICLLLMLVILLQKGRGGGLSGAFGGVGGHSAFGAKTGDVFTWVTVGLAAAFVVVACIGTFVYIPQPLATTPPAIVQPGGGAAPGADGGPVSPDSPERPATTQPGS